MVFGATTSKFNPIFLTNEINNNLVTFLGSFFGNLFLGIGINNIIDNFLNLGVRRLGFIHLDLEFLVVAKLHLRQNIGASSILGALVGNIFNYIHLFDSDWCKFGLVESSRHSGTHSNIDCFGGNVIRQETFLNH